jgi:hypothetical protein
LFFRFLRLESFNLSSNISNFQKALHSIFNSILKASSQRHKIFKKDKISQIFIRALISNPQDFINHFPSTSCLFSHSMLLPQKLKYYHFYVSTYFIGIVITIKKFGIAKRRRINAHKAIKMTSSTSLRSHYVKH